MPDEIREQEQENEYDLAKLEEMSDEEFEEYTKNLNFDQFDPDNEPQETTDATEDNDEAESDEGEDEQPSNDANEEAEGDTGDNSEDQTEVEKTTEEDTTETKDVEEKEEKKEPLPFDTVLAPLKVQGTEVPINSVEELRTLAGKSIEQQKQLDEVSSNKKYILALEKAGVLNDEGINRLIALNNKDPRAVSKLINSVDVDELPDGEELEDYVPENVIPEEQEIAVGNILGTLSQSPVYDDLLNLLQNELDEKSQRSLYDRPEGISTLAEHMEKGVFETVKNEVNKQKLLGNISKDVPFIDAYKFVGTQMYQGDGNKEQTPQTNETTSKKKKASKSKPNAFQKEQRSKGTRIDELTLDDLDNMSDEEFLEKVGNLKL